MKSKIRQVATSQRRHFRVIAPVIITINGQEFSASNWSLSGFQLTGFSEHVKPGDVFDVHLNLPFQGFNIGFAAKAKVVYYEPSTETMGAEFENLDNRSRKALETFVDGIIRGEMETADGVIKSLDVPVTPISLKDEGVSGDFVHAENQRRKRGVRLYSYAVLALTAVIGVVVYTTFFQLKIETAVVMGIDDVINAPANGVVTYLAKLDEPVSAGTELVSVADPKLDNDIRLANIDVEKASADVQRINSILHHDLFTTAVQNALVVKKSVLDTLKEQKATRTINAPTNGHIVRIFTPLNSPAKFGAPVAVFKRDENPKIQAFLTQREAINIVKGQKAKAYLQDGTGSFPVTVTDIDYYSLTLNQAQGHYQWQNLLNANFKTVIVIVEPSQDVDRAKLSKTAPGAVATVIF